MVLEFADLRDVRGQGHDLDHLARGVSDRSRVGEHIFGLAVQAGDHGLQAVGLAVGKGGVHRTIRAGLVAMAENLVAQLAHALAEIGLIEGVVGHHPVVAVAHGDVARRGLEQVHILLLGDAQLFLEPFDFADVDRYFQHQLHLAVGGGDGRGVDHDRQFVAVFAHHGLARALALAGLEGLPDRTVEAAQRLADVDLPAVVPDHVAEPFLVELVGGHHLERTVVHGHEAGHFVEIAGPVAEIGRQPRNGLAHGLDHLAGGELALQFHHPTGLLVHELFQILGVPAQLPAHGQLFVDAFERRIQDVVIDGLGDEVRRLVLQAADRQVHVPMARDHDHFRVRGPGLDAL